MVLRGFGLAGLLVVAAAAALLSEEEGHTLSLVVRTVRYAADGPSLAMGALVGFTALAFLVLAFAPRFRPGLLLSLPIVALGVGLVAGTAEAATEASRATTALTIAQRSDLLALGLVRAAAIFALGALVASALLAGAGVAIGSRALGVVRGRPDVGALFAGVASLMAVVLVLGERHPRNVGWIGCVPSSVGLVASFFATRGLRSDDASVRSAASTRLTRVAILGVAAVGCTATARGLVAAVGLGDDGVADWTRVIRDFDVRFLAEAGPPLWFVVPLGVTSLVALRKADVVPFAPLRATAAFALAATLLTGLSPWALRRPTTRLTTLRQVLTPSTIALPAIAFGADCEALEEDQVVSIGADRVHHGAIDVGPASVLDDATGCAAFVTAQLQPGTSGAWLAVDASATFARVGCLLGALADARGREVPMGTSPRRRLGSAMLDTPCTLFWLARDARSDAASCAAFTLAHPSCEWGVYAEDVDIWPEKSYEVELGEPDAIFMRTVVQGVTLERRRVPRDLEHDAQGRLRFAGLEGAVRVMWAERGTHVYPDDRAFDLLLVRAAPSTPVTEVVAALEAIRAVTRPFRTWRGVVDVPAFDVSMALLR